MTATLFIMPIEKTQIVPNILYKLEIIVSELRKLDCSKSFLYNV